jgi:DegV family protein with EDD domain
MHLSYSSIEENMITIIADTTCSIPQPELNRIGIPYLPQMIIFGDQQYRDDTEINTAQFLAKLRSSSTLPKTAAPAPALYLPIYKKEIDAGNSVIVLTPSGEMSGTLRSATVAAEDFPGADIHIVDTRTIASGLGSLVLQAHKWALEGMSATTIVEKINELASRQRVYFVVDTLEYLYKGGRIGGASALFGSILQVKPILTLRNGRAEAAETQRTKKRALARIVEIIEQECPHDESGMLSISQCEAEEDATALAGEFTRVTGIKDIPIYEVPPAIVVHAGPKVMAISFFTK